MRHFMEQFGPALEWPWTKLTDVPELTDELLDTLAAQSDAQAAGRSARELERRRDDCLVARAAGAAALEEVGAGATLAALGARRCSARRRRRRRRLAAALRRARSRRLDRLQRPRQREPLPAALRRRDRRAARLSVGVDAGYLAGGGSYYTVETHLSHLRELHAGDRLPVTTQVLAADEKRLHVFHVLLRDGRGRSRSRPPSRCSCTSTATSGRAAPAREPSCANASRELRDARVAAAPRARRPRDRRPAHAT